MPLYRFICSDCHHEERLLLKINEETPPCSKCGGKLVKQISRVANFKFGKVGTSETGSSGCSGCSGGSCSSCGG